MATKIEKLERYDADGFAYGEGAWVTYSAARSQIDALLKALKQCERKLTELYPSAPAKAEHEDEYYAVNTVLNNARAVIHEIEATR